MKFVIGLAAALIFGTLGAVATPAMAQGGAKSTMETGSNASDTKGAGMSSDKMSGGKKKMKKKKM